jgi:branched-chain amino acid transport system substrate-binding protein
MEATVMWLKPKPSRALAAVAGVAVTLVVATACSSSSNSSSGGSGGTAASGSPVKIMLIYDNTGPGASPELIQGETAAVNVINKSGGIKGRPVKLIVCATQNNPNTADGCAREAVSDGVSAVVGELTLQKAHETILTQNHIPIIGAILSGTDFTVPAQFPISGTTVVEIPSDARALADGGSKKISLARIEIDGGQAFKGFANSGLKSLGMHINNDVPIQIGAPDMAPYVHAVLANGTDGVIVILDGPDAIAFIKALKSTNPNIPIALVGTQKEKVYEALGSASNGIISSLFELPPAYKNAATETYVKAMHAAGYTELRGFRLDSYAAVMTFAAVAKAVPDPTSAALWKYLPTVSGLNIGLTPPIQFTTGDVAGLPRVFTSCAFVVKEENQADVPVSDTFIDAFTGKSCPTPAQS